MNTRHVNLLIISNGAWRYTNGFPSQIVFLNVVTMSNSSREISTVSLSVGQGKV